MNGTRDLPVDATDTRRRPSARHLDRRMHKDVALLQKSLLLLRAKISLPTLRSAKKMNLISVEKELRTVIPKRLRLRLTLMRVNV